MATRDTLNDFLAHVRARPGHTITSSSDGTLQVSQNGVVKHPRVLWLSGGGARTDANPRGDRVIVIFADNSIGISDAQSYIDGLK